MKAIDVKDGTISSLAIDDTVGDALTMLSEVRMWSLPLLNEEECLYGIIEYYDLEDKDRSAKVLEFVKKFSVSVEPDVPLFEVLRVWSDLESDMLPIVDSGNEYIGVITPSSLLEGISTQFSDQPKGSVIVLRMAHWDYSLQEISRLIENNNAKVLHVAVTSSTKEQHTEMMVTVKLNVKNPARVVATFERFGYNVFSMFQEDEPESLDRERLDNLFRFLEF